MHVSEAQRGLPPSDLADQREQLAEILGLEQAVSEQVLVAALQDEDYARNLLICRRHPGMLEQLLSRPPRRPRPAHATELAARGATALARWAATGFTTVDETTFADRLSACDACPNLTRRESPNPVCGLCGCRVRWKARLSSESCPAPSPGNPTHTRWGEPAPHTSSAAARLTDHEESRD